MDKKIMLHHLRNPYGVEDLEMREARLQAANELERLYGIEERTKSLLKSLQAVRNDINEKS